MAVRVDVQIALECMNLKPEDAQVNRWHFLLETDPPASGTLDDITDELEAFYLGLTAWMSNQVFSGNAYLKAYDMSDPEPRAPIRTATLALTGLSSSQSLPPEVSCCLSFEAVPISGTNQARRRNRVFLPTFLANRTTGTGVWSTATMDGVAATAQTLLDASDAAVDWKWVVVSEVQGTTAAVDRGWVDDAVDIQRRRGRDAVARSLFAL